MIDQHAGPAIERVRAVGVGRGLHDLHPRRDGEEVESAAPSLCLLVAAIDHHQVVGERPIRLMLVGMVPQVTQVGQQLVPVFPVVEIQAVQVMVAAVVAGVQQGEALATVGRRSAGSPGRGRETPRRATRRVPPHALPVPAPQQQGIARPAPRRICPAISFNRARCCVGGIGGGDQFGETGPDAASYDTSRPMAESGDRLAASRSGLASSRHTACRGRR